MREKKKKKRAHITASFIVCLEVCAGVNNISLPKAAFRQIYTILKIKQCMQHFQGKELLFYFKPLDIY